MGPNISLPAHHFSISFITIKPNTETHARMLCHHADGNAQQTHCKQQHSCRRWLKACHWQFRKKGIAFILFPISYGCYYLDALINKIYAKHTLLRTMHNSEHLYVICEFINVAHCLAKLNDEKLEVWLRFYLQRFNLKLTHKICINQLSFYIHITSSFLVPRFKSFQFHE